MKKTLHHFLLPLFLLAFIQTQSQQLLYENNNLGNRIYNPGFGSGNTPKIIFDDINFASSLTASSDSVVISQVTVAIGRAPGSPATVVNVYASAPDSAYDSLNSLPAIPPKLIGTFNLPASGPSGFFSIGDNLTPLAAFKLDTGRFIKGYQTLYIGLSFSDSVQSNIGWYLSNGPDTNYNLIYKYDITNTDTPVAALNLSGTYNLPATFYAVVNGTFKTAVILPVVLSSFNVSQKNNFNVLEWQTQSENNTDRFIIERSNDGRLFKTIGQVAAAGFSTKTVSYQFNDDAPLTGINYYRLHLIDKDNVNSYSKTVSIASLQKKYFNVSPNPVASNKFTANFNAVYDGTATMQIKNINGRTVYSKTINILQGDNSVSINDTHLSAGVYYVSITNKEIQYLGKLQKM